MFYHTFSTIIILLLKVFIGLSVPPARQFDTGYTYNVIGDNDNREEDLKCAYLLSSLRHMRLTRLQVAYLSSKTTPTLNNINSFGPVIRDQLATLYQLKTVRFGALWLVLLYTGNVEHYKTLLFQSGNTKEELHGKFLSTHDYVIEKLVSDASGCPDGNRFSDNEVPITDRQMSKPAAITHLINSHKKQVRSMLSFNHDNCQLTFRYIHDFDVKKLFMYDFGTNEFAFLLMRRYNVKMNWSNTGARLHAAWINARDLDWAVSNLQPIKLYCTMVFDFIKVIFLRLTHKHILYLMTIKVPHRHTFVHEWFGLLQEFANIFVFVNDTHIRYLLNAFNSETIIRQSSIENLIEYINVAVSRTSESLGCTANEPVTIADDVQLLPRDAYIPNTDVNRSRILKHSLPIARISLMNAYDFMDHVKKAFMNINFDVIRLLVDYIDELNEFRLF